MIIHFTRGFSTKVSYAEIIGENLIDSTASLSPELEHYNSLLSKYADKKQEIDKLKRDVEELSYEMYSDIVAPYHFGDKVTLRAYPGYAPLNPYVLKGVLEYNSNSNCISIREIKKNGELSKRTHSIFFSYFEVSDYEE